VLKIGHRGAKGWEPENTLRSFHKAVAWGVDMIEFDIRATKDGKIVVFHDARLERLTEAFGRLRDWTLAELEKLEVGGEEIPALAKVFDTFRGRVGFNVELKETGIADEVLELIRHHQVVDSVLVSAFASGEAGENSTATWQDLFWMKVKEPNLKIALLAKSREWAEHAILAAHDNGIFARETPFPVYALNLHKDAVDAALMQRSREETSAKVLVWTVNRADEMKRLKDLGVEGIFSDYPDEFDKAGL